MSEQAWQQRTEILFGADGIERLRRAHALVVGLGGVGAYAAEMLCRAGIGEMTLVDGDTVNDTNRNRQLVALKSTVGLPKTTVLAMRLRDINPDVVLHVYQTFLRDEATATLLEAARYDFVLDAIDTLSPKVFLLYHAVQHGLRVISSMGAGGKCDPQQVRLEDISKSEYCHLARFVRKRLHKMGIRSGITVVYSPEAVEHSAIVPTTGEPNKLTTVGTVSYMPAVFGCFMASYVIRQIVNS